MAALLADLRDVARADTPSLRAVRCRHSREWRSRPAAFVFAAASDLARHKNYRWVAFELIRFHRPALEELNDESVSALAKGLDSWGSVDAFGRILSGPAWAHGLISDALIDSWSRSSDRWLRRAALVTSIELRDPARVLPLYERLAGDRDDMVEKALSWALRELGKRHPAAVMAFLSARGAQLGARVRREVGNKLRTGLKNPRRSSNL